MNTRIEAGPMSISVGATLVVPVILVQNVSLRIGKPVRAWTCFTSPIMSVNGHSLKSINPELKVGELATSLA